MGQDRRPGVVGVVGGVGGAGVDMDIDMVTATAQPHITGTAQHSTVSTGCGGQSERLAEYRYYTVVQSDRRPQEASLVTRATRASKAEGNRGN